MLQRLSIKNYALIDAVEIDFSPDLNIITGETGAGKSIMLGALALILGQRSESRYFYNQEKKCIIEGTFEISSYALQDFFTANELDFENPTLLRREIHHDGRSRAFINDSPVNLSTLKQLGERLIEIHSQHAVLELSKESFQLLTLDAIAQNADLMDAYRRRYQILQQKQKKLKQLQSTAQQARSEADYQQFLFDELSQADFQPGEQENLESELSKLTHAEEIKRQLGYSLSVLEVQEPSILQSLKEVYNQLGQIEKYDTRLHELVSRVQSCHIELKDITAELASLEADTYIDDERMGYIQDRLDLLYRLQQKHQVSTIDALHAIQHRLAAQLDSIQSNDTAIEELTDAIKVLAAEVQDLASKLSQRRTHIIPLIQEQVETQLADLGIPKAQFRVHLSSDPLHASVNGQDKVQFHFSANAGQAPQEVGKVASGGELSRLMLAIKSLIAQKTALPTIIFDEIDTGISGEVALQVGQSIEQLSRHLQVVAITHLPQIASKGHMHFKVSKEEQKEKTRTRIEALTAAQRVDEIAEMLSGKQAGHTALQHAKELLGMEL